MFTRSSSAEPETLIGNSNAASQHRRPGLVETIARQDHRPDPGKPSSLSVISNDLKIIGKDLKIVSRGTLQVDGEVEGDVAGTEIIIGELGQVRGTVAAERVTVQGRASGVIRALSVTLQSSARVQGDIYHSSLVVEQGAVFDGRCRRPSDVAEIGVDAALN
jgi:cytoskeletal protein CcmA (bactofilin family)